MLQNSIDKNLKSLLTKKAMVMRQIMIFQNLVINLVMKKVEHKWSVLPDLQMKFFNVLKMNKKNKKVRQEITL